MIKKIFRIIFDYLKKILNKFFTDGCHILASSIAFYFIFSIFPLMLIAISISGIVINRFNVQADILEFVSERIPIIYDFVDNNISQIIANKTGIGILGIIFLFFAATYVFDSLQFALNKIFRTENQRRYWKQKLYGFLIIFILFLIVLITFSLSTGLFYLTNILSTFFKIEGPFNNALLKIVSVVIGVISNFLVFILVYYFGLSKKIAFKHIYIGALVAALGWEAIKYIFIFYIDRFANYQLTYGSIASVIAFLLWVYISGLIFLLGAEINSIHKIQ